MKTFHTVEINHRLDLLPFLRSFKMLNIITDYKMVPPLSTPLIKWYHTLVSCKWLCHEINKSMLTSFAHSLRLLMLTPFADAHYVHSITSFIRSLNHSTHLLTSFADTHYVCSIALFICSLCSLIHSAHSLTSFANQLKDPRE